MSPFLALQLSISNHWHNRSPHYPRHTLTEAQHIAFHVCTKPPAIKQPAVISTYDHQVYPSPLKKKHKSFLLCNASKYGTRVCLLRRRRRLGTTIPYHACNKCWGGASSNHFLYVFIVDCLGRSACCIGLIDVCAGNRDCFFCRLWQAGTMRFLSKCSFFQTYYISEFRTEWLTLLVYLTI